MQITHEEAQSLIQLKADDALNTDQQNLLDRHLADCRICAEYSSQVVTVESTVRSVMRSHWKARSLPLRLVDLQERVDNTQWLTTLLPTRKALISFSTVLLLFMAWQLLLTGNVSGTSTSLAVPPIPTPGMSTASTQFHQADCETKSVSLLPSPILPRCASPSADATHPPAATAIMSDLQWLTDTPG